MFKSPAKLCKSPNSRARDVETNLLAMTGCLLHSSRNKEHEKRTRQAKRNEDHNDNDQVEVRVRQSATSRIVENSNHPF